MSKNQTEHLFSSIYKKYSYDVFPHVKSIRGATRLKNILEKSARFKLEKIEEGDTVPIYKKNWQNLIIIDACRHDLFEEVYGASEERLAIGSATPKYIERTFSEKNFEDVVYITANPFFSPDTFRELTGKNPDEVFHTVFPTYSNKWDEEESTVMPEKVVEDLETAQKLFPDKRKIIHFIQPHHPFINSEVNSEGFGLNSPERGIWAIAEEENIYSDEDIWRAYKSNLEFVKPYVKEAAEIVSGKTALTSDHGNLVGEYGLYGHPAPSKAKTLRKVPWKIIKE